LLLHYLLAQHAQARCKFRLIQLAVAVLVELLNHRRGERSRIKIAVGLAFGLMLANRSSHCRGSTSSWSTLCSIPLLIRRTFLLPTPFVGQPVQSHGQHQDGRQRQNE
jgi:hypothetical protein